MKICENNKNWLRIFLDLDGVVAFWEKSASMSLGIDLNDKLIRDHLKKGYDINNFVDGGEEKMWEIIGKEGEEWWENMEILPWGKNLYNFVKDKSDYFCFLTSPSNNPSCASGKVKWLKKHFGNNFKDFLIGRNKHLCACKNSLLIDDNAKKINKFKEFGGNVFKWPNPLLIMDGDISLESVFENLSDCIDSIKFESIGGQYETQKCIY